MKTKDIIQIERIIIVSAVILILIGITEMTLGFFSNSVGLVADGVDSIGNSLVSFVVWMGIRFSRKAPDNKFRFGYYRVETLASFIAAIIMCGLSILIAYNAYQRFLRPEPLYYPIISMITVASAGIITFVISIVKNKFASKYKNLLSLKTDATNSIKDFSGSFIILVGISLYYYTGFPWGDAVGAMIVSFFIFSYGINIVKESSLILVDAFYHPELIRDIKTIIRRYPMLKIKDIRLRRSGPYIRGAIILKTNNKNMTIGQYIKIKEEIKRKIRKELDGVKDLIISIE